MVDIAFNVPQVQLVLAPYVIVQLFSPMDYVRLVVPIIVCMHQVVFATIVILVVRLVLLVAMVVVLLVPSIIIILAISVLVLVLLILWLVH